jgi:hypothetical protein
MSLRAITEPILHLEQFRNIDLIQQGIYFMKFQIFHEVEDKQYFANPYFNECRDAEVVLSNLKAPKVSFHRLMEPYIENETNSFVSKTFFVRYADEIVVLRDIVKFRTEVEVQPGYLDVELFLKVELYYQPPPATTSKNFSRCMGDA